MSSAIQEVAGPLSNEFEIGYDFWWRKKEKISLKQGFPATFGIFDLAGMNGVP